MGLCRVGSALSELEYLCVVVARPLHGVNHYWLLSVLHILFIATVLEAILDNFKVMLVYVDMIVPSELNIARLLVDTDNMVYVNQKTITGILIEYFN